MMVASGTSTPDFDHGGGDQQLGFAGLEGGHGGIALGGFHLAMHQADL